MSGSAEGMSTPMIAVDTGGTFTDLILLEGGRVTRLKVPSTPADPAAAVLEGIARLLAGSGADAVRSPFDLVHGSTVATNAVLERKGARVVLVTNRGFEDVIEIGRQNRPQLYALTGWRLPPLVGRDDRIGIAGRLDASGEELAPLDPAELAALRDRVEGGEAIAVVLLHSYANPDHEEAVGAALSGIPAHVTLSSRILPEFREFERTATAVVNAYVAPKVAGYLGRIEAQAGARSIRIMGSGGGALPLSRAMREPVHTVLSGPAGGVIGALEWGRRIGIDRLLTFDMGGTSTDVSLVPGAPLHTREGEIGGIPVSIPLLDIHTVGAGGGSLAEIDPAGALRVGPASAGADPGPIAYGNGGMGVTVTDANLWLGRLLPEGFLGGSGSLNREAVRSPITELADQAGLSAEALAEGIIEVVNTAMERALRVISVERGADPGDFHLLAFGGAAGLHAAELSERLALRGVLIPPDPGLLSAFGMLVAPVVRDRARTVHLSSDAAGTEAELISVLDELEGLARREMESEGAPLQALRVQREVDARYRGQSHELRVPAEGWISAFHALHRERYGYGRPESPLEAVTVRVRVELPGAAVAGSAARAGSAEVPRVAPVYWQGDRVSVDVHQREHLTPGRSVPGPALILEYSSTTWCPPGWTIRRDTHGVLHMEPDGAS